MRLNRTPATHLSTMARPSRALLSALPPLQRAHGGNERVYNMNSRDSQPTLVVKGSRTLLVRPCGMGIRHRFFCLWKILGRNLTGGGYPRPTTASVAELVLRPHNSLSLHPEAFSSREGGQPCHAEDSISVGRKGEHCRICTSETAHRSEAERQESRQK